MTFTPIIPPTPQLTDGVVALRLWSVQDAPFVHLALQDPDIPRFTAIPENHTYQAVERRLATRGEAFAAGEQANFAVVSAEDGRILGSIGVRRLFDDPATGEVSYWTAASERGRGVARRALALMVMWVFDAMTLERLQIAMHVDNRASRAVATACGFRFEGVLRGYRTQHDQRVDMAVYGLLVSDVFGAPS